jgi:hypothetical protein
MDKLPEQYAYRCLPLLTANSHGWELPCPSGFTATWNGGGGLDAIAIEADDPNGFKPVSHFGAGVLTFHPGYLFSTEPGYNLWIGGPPNERRSGIVALTGVVETDWSAHGFTMNWAFTAPNVPVRFEAGDAFCVVFPLPRGYLDEFEPEIRSLDHAPELKQEHLAWQESRRQFLTDLPKRDSQAHRDKWQKGYYRGDRPSGEKGPDDHQVKLHLKAFADKRTP